ncbi:alpha/beta fold hydrolase [Actinomycetospora chiangmaiensis]|uniref:alpha/beta fold hydrolase n=1 Tax=Actinomycetospora chiangmaiensis TaxID=402650 RepID=UPI00037E08B2|nr:alpha/beta fold hydrolase [Actinomycetospora chiangmaiensis]
MTPAAPVVLHLDRNTPTALELTVHRAPDASAPAVLVVPAMGLRASFYTPLLQALAAHGCHGATLELRGHQRRPAPRPGRSYDYGYADLVGDLDAGLARLRATLPGAAVHTLGHSFGGHIVAAHAALRPSTIDSAVLLATGSVDWRAWGAIGPWHLLRTQAALAVTQLLGHFPGPQVGFAGREARTQMTEWARWGRTGRLRIGHPPVDIAAAATDAELPLLFVSLAGDALAPARTTDALAALFPRATVSRRHLRLDVARPHYDWARHPDTVLSHLTSWFGSPTR